MSDVMARIGLIQLQVGRVRERAHRAADEGNLAAVTACREEMEVLLESMRSIREEQLLAELAPTPKVKKRRWWPSRGER